MDNRQSSLTHKGAPIQAHARLPFAPLSDRKVVFISHANPEDNAAAAWFGARLTALGYQVWTDITRLLGGEEMWLDIDDVLRFNARKVVVLLSRAAADPAKDGVRAELDRAHVYRRKLADRRFIIPLRIDDVPYDDLPPTISNRTIIPAAGNYATALARVVEILEEDSVSRTPAPTADALLLWQKALVPPEATLETANDSLVSNWFELRSLPERIHFYEIARPLSNSASEPAQIAKEHPLPCGHHLRRLVSFATWDALQEPIAGQTPIKLDHSMALEVFLSGGDSTVPIEQQEAAKLVTSLIRQAFDGMARAKGLQPFELSERKIAWWIPEGLLPNDKSSFVRQSGLPGWRQLTGKFSLRERTWHFGVNGVPVLGGTPRIRITPHVIYTDPKGKLPATAEFRRSQAKLWFNAKWRDLVYAMMAFLADGRDVIPLSFGGGVSVTLGASAMSVSLDVRPPVSFERKARKVVGDGGDAEDLDVSDYAGDPALGSLVAEDEDLVDTVAEDEELSIDEEQYAGASDPHP